LDKSFMSSVGQHKVDVSIIQTFQFVFHLIEMDFLHLSLLILMVKFL